MVLVCIIWWQSDVFMKNRHVLIVVFHFGLKVSDYFQALLTSVQFSHTISAKRLSQQ